MSYRLAAVRSAVDSGMGGEFAFVEDERRSRQLHRIAASDSAAPPKMAVRDKAVGGGGRRASSKRAVKQARTFQLKR